jgi:hypothetical protein
VGEIDGMEENEVLNGCKRLLTASDLLITSEEEILCLMDTGPQTYRRAYKNGELSWQQNFSAQV